MVKDDSKLNADPNAEYPLHYGDNKILLHRPVFRSEDEIDQLWEYNRMMGRSPFGWLGEGGDKG